MIRHEYMRNILALTRRLSLTQCNNASSKIDIEKLEKESESIVEVYDEEVAERETLIQQSRNKSRLREQDYAILHNRNPYPEPRLWHHGTVKYQRKIYGRYGAASGVNPALCWPTKEELANSKDYERTKYNYNILEVAAEAKEQKKAKYEEKWARQKLLVERVQKLEQWKKEMFDRIAKKENDMKAAKDRRERLIEEVRRHFGYKVDPKDDKFKELLEKKEKEQKKIDKEARKKAKEEKMMQQLLKKKSGGQTDKISEEDETEAEKDSDKIIKKSKE